MDSIAALYNSSSDSAEESDGDGPAAAPPAPAARADPSDADADADAATDRKRKREDADEPPSWIRAFAHVEGNWPSHVSVSVGVDGDAELRELCRRVVERAQQQLGADVALVPIGGGDEQLAGYHLSLSRPFALRYEQITPFVLELRAALKWRRRFVVSLAGATVLVNDERTRSFLALRVADGAKDVAATLQCVDACMKRFALPLYYEVRPAVRVLLCVTSGTVC